ncbi:MAG: zf-HC2 domain-containing protein [Ktedonobacteraceae bacterium]|nr:zf-HC2 domain-containing protein [Ktedonobacteraceae bacterium]
MAQDKRHLTTEQLSALLDREASAEEQAQWQAHLSTCPQCQRALTTLRQTVAMLHALPQLTLPRSFVLPVEAAEPQPALSRSFALPMDAAEPISPPIAAAPILIRPSHRRLNPYVRGVLRTVSALAAMIGVVFFLSGVLPSLRYGGASSTATSSSGYSEPASGDGVTTQSNTVKSPTAMSQHASSSRATATATPLVKAAQPLLPTDQGSNNSNQPGPSLGFTFLIFNLSTPAGRVGLGMILVILGGMGFVLFKRSRRA